MVKKTKFYLNYQYEKYLIISFLVVVSSCTSSIPKNVSEALELSGKNKVELQKVLDYYSAPQDSLKLKAAYFLIGNMLHHHYISGANIEKYTVVFDSLEKIERKSINRKILVANTMIDSLNKKLFLFPEKIRDIESIHSEYLIENIEYSFKAWNENPSQVNLSFKEFCNYVLPYRSQNEVLEKGSRKFFYEKYHWVLDSLKAGKDVEKTIIQMMSGTYFRYDWRRVDYPYSYKITELEKKGFGTCSDITPYWVSALRSIGIPCAYESIPHWGNHHSSGHDWLAVKIKDSFKPTDPFIPKFNILDEIIKKGSTPKVYRKTFARGMLDVSSDYLNTSDFEFDITMNNTENIDKPSLYVFDKKRGWVAVALGKKSGSKVYFQNIGKKCIYLLGYNNYEQIVPLNYPFWINKNEDVKFFIPDKKNLDTQMVLRKYQPYSAFEIYKSKWSTSLTGCKLQGANFKDFSDAEDLYIIKGHNSSHKQTYYMNEKSKSYLRYRLISHNEYDSYLSELEFYDTFENQIIGQPFGKHSSTAGAFELYYSLDKNVNYVFDSNSLTYYGGNDYTAGMSFDTPKKIHSIKIQSRNDDNHIRVNDTYELLFWDKHWVSLGRKKAIDTLLIYEKCPRKALFWLKNHTSGHEEHVFNFDNKGKQIWSSTLF